VPVLKLSLGGGKLREEYLQEVRSRIQPKKHSTRLHTSSSAVAERPRDALCPSVVSFNSVIPRAQSFIIVILRLQIYHCVQLNAALLSSV